MTTTEQVPQMISLSQDATVKVTELLTAESDDAMALRVAVKAGGCSGFSYQMFFDADANPDDRDLMFGSATVRVDSASASHLAGATLNYSNGLQGAGFSLDNPNATRSCGCGQSFS